ncbi:hypothetical protein E2C01_042413 [Portunus trituberculatus]|uniref:Uncharacterized protein n=1 Tax=Portunus trituberculatus TaxID=210409 RepID=A0A5B7FUL3_PORTR|nr:hypothetical protein [Portunus trituberculatus]
MTSAVRREPATDKYLKPSYKPLPPHANKGEATDVSAGIHIKVSVEAKKDCSRQGKHRTNYSLSSKQIAECLDYNEQIVNCLALT